MSETTSGEVGQITTGQEAGKKYVCRFALREADGLFFVWDKKVPGLDLLEDGAELTITHDGSKYKKVEKIELPGQEAKEHLEKPEDWKPGKTKGSPTKEPESEQQRRFSDLRRKEETKPTESKIEQAMKKEEVKDAEAWRIARRCATERVFGNGVIKGEISIDAMNVKLRLCDEIATYIVTGQKPSKKKE